MDNNEQNEEVTKCGRAYDESINDGVLSEQANKFNQINSLPLSFNLNRCYTVFPHLPVKYMC